MKNWKTRHIDIALGQRIAEQRVLKGLGRKQLANSIGISVSSLQHHEEGRDRFSAAQIWQICGILGLSVAEVFEDLPNRVFATVEEAQEATDRPQLDEAGAFQPRSSVAEEGSTNPDPPTVREDIQELARAARYLDRPRVRFLTEMVRGMKVAKKRTL